MNNSLIFIPDISGFTRFVNETEISHSRHIISELLELIINSDQLGLTVSEIEGDAILFYKTGEIPHIVSILEQCKHMFSAFHNYLNIYKTDRICRCGACRTAHELSLKFIVHQGPVEEIKIKKHLKLHGSDVILAHKLLKNEIPEDEYAIFTDSFKETVALGKEEFVEWKEQKEDIGEVSMHYVSFKKLAKEIHELPQMKIEYSGGRIIKGSVLLNKDIGIVYEYVTDFERRLMWNKQIKDILTEEELNKAGSVHQCIIGNDQLSIETIGRMEDQEKITYGERVSDFKVFEELNTYFIMRVEGDQTQVELELEVKLKPLYKLLLSPFVYMGLKRSINTSLKDLSDLINNID